MNRYELHIIVNAQGQMQIQGPINDKMVCYGLLESAKDAVREFHDQQAKSPIVQPDSRDLSLAFSQPLGRS